jgi:hypothetical protein
MIPFEAEINKKMLFIALLYQDPSRKIPVE